MADFMQYSAVRSTSPHATKTAWVKVENNQTVGLLTSGKVFVVGDLHLSDVYEGKHKDYWGNCLSIMEDLCKRVAEIEPSVIVLLGDIIGCNETNIRSRENLSRVLNYFRIMDSYAPIVAVRGNHDIAGYPDFKLLTDLGLVSRVDHFDYYHGNDPQVRFHLVDYGDEARALDLWQGENVSNVVFGHQDYMIDGVTTWYPQMKGGVELTTLQNYCGVDLVISGHIHTPSEGIVTTSMPDGSECSLFYTGCPTRPTKEGGYTQVWYMTFAYDDTSAQVDFDFIPVELPPCEEIFYEDETMLNEKTQAEIDEEVRKEALKEVLSDVMEYRLLQGDYLAQIDKIPNASEEAKVMAKNYVQMVMSGERVR